MPGLAGRLAARWRGYRVAARDDDRVIRLGWVAVPAGPDADAYRRRHPAAHTAAEAAAHLRRLKREGNPAYRRFLPLLASMLAAGEEWPGCVIFTRVAR